MDQESRLKIYFGPNEQLEVNDQQPRTQPKDEQHVVVKLGAILDSLTDAIKTDRSWPNDFRDDDVTISKDLYEVITTYSKMKRSA